ncbi:MAG: VTT domain-containing protein [Candidatus Altiarchaeota archaeon]
MFESISKILIQYGFFGLFLASFLSSTVFFPFATELLIPVFLLHLKDIYAVIFVLSFGSTLGTCVNYAIGFALSKRTIERYVSKEKILSAGKFMNKYGWSGLFIVLTLPIPGIPVDVITILPGLTKMKFEEFFFIVFISKIVRYAIFVGLSEQLLHLFL